VDLVKGTQALEQIVTDGKRLFQEQITELLVRDITVNTPSTKTIPSHAIASGLHDSYPYMHRASLDPLPLPTPNINQAIESTPRYHFTHLVPCSRTPQSFASTHGPGPADTDGTILTHSTTASQLARKHKGKGK
jgi:hypothetical protein